MFSSKEYLTNNRFYHVSLRENSINRKKTHLSNMPWLCLILLVFWSVVMRSLYLASVKWNNDTILYAKSFVMSWWVLYTNQVFMKFPLLELSRTTLYLPCLIKKCSVFNQFLKAFWPVQVQLWQTPLHAINSIFAMPISILFLQFQFSPWFSQ